jgi:hypothetical protein
VLLDEECARDTPEFADATGGDSQPRRRRSRLPAYPDLVAVTFFARLELQRASGEKLMKGQRMLIGQACDIINDHSVSKKFFLILGKRR